MPEICKGGCPPKHRLQFYAVIKRNPSGSGFQFTPALSRTGSCFFFNNCEYAFACIGSSLRIAVIFDRWFIATDELNEFCKSIGYENPDYPNDFDLMFDPRVVQFCQQNLTKLWGEHVYRGRESCDFRCGFGGAGYIRTIDTSKTWRLSYNHVDAPVIDYVQVSTNKYGYLSVL